MSNRNSQFDIIIRLAEEGVYIASVPTLPGCITQGETLSDVEKNISDAIEAYLEVLKTS